MGRVLLALALYVGLVFFLGVNALSILFGASMTTAMLRGLTALGVFAVLGIVASLLVRVKPSAPPESESQT